MSDIKINDDVTVLGLVCAPKFVVKLKYVKCEQEKCSKISALKVLQN